jgi:molybdenum cofactor cytidylyltransferase
VTAGILLLAAGQSRRFGSDKRVASLEGGQTLLCATLAHISATSLPVQICLRPDDAALQLELETKGFSCLRCDRAGEGMGATLAQGVAAIPDWDAVIVMLADMPWVQSATLRALVSKVTHDTIVVPVYQGRRGNPVAFGRMYFPALARCQGDQGARSLLRSHEQQVRDVRVDDPGVLRDIDCPADLERGL